MRIDGLEGWMVAGICAVVLLASSLGCVRGSISKEAMRPRTPCGEYVLTDCNVRVSSVGRDAIVVEGNVYDCAGHPVGGAYVVAFKGGPELDGGIPYGDTVISASRTDDAGRVRLDGVPFVSHLLVDIERRGFEATSIERPGLNSFCFVAALRADSKGVPQDNGK